MPEYIEPIYNKHYIRTDEQNRIIYGFSDAFRQPTETDICINEQGGYQFRLFAGGEENLIPYNSDGVALYKWEDGQILPRTSEEIEADRANRPVPTPSASIEERIAAAEDAITALAFGGALQCLY